LVDRRRVLERIRISAVPLIGLIAPAGYGKTYIANRIAREEPHWAAVDMDAVPDADAFAAALAAVPKLAEFAAGGFESVLDGWSACDEPIALVLENVDNVSGGRVLNAVASLVCSRPAHGKLIMCARRALPLELSDLAAPHLVATLRATDLRFDEAEMTQAVRGYGSRRDRRVSRPALHRGLAGRCAVLAAPRA
jgi:ATP/maltotriose-dependent transcriptional regulator MalT